tara:strand:- start:245 stop:352 length:108 start_codon:yes stop_codon:yes gene_type:complete
MTIGIIDFDKLENVRNDPPLARHAINTYLELELDI